MQAMQDKDFDKVFKEQFEDAEIAPPAGLWSAIEAEIAPRKKYFIGRYWAAAAAILVFGAVTFIVYQNSEVSVLNNQVSVVKPSKPTQQVDGEVKAKVEEQLDTRVQIAKTLVVTAKEKFNNQVQPKKAILIKGDDVSIPQNNVLASVDKPNLDATITPNISQTSSVKMVELAPIHEEIVLAAVETSPLQQSAGEKDVAPEKGIKNAGDLINLVVGAVDKGKNKFIRFKSNDEGSTLAAINIGPFRFGKRSD